MTERMPRPIPAANPRPSWRALGHALAMGFGVFCALQCTGLDNFAVDVTSRARIPAATPLSSLLSDVLPFSGLQGFDISRQLSNQGVDQSDVDSVHLVSLELVITAPPGADFSFLERLDVQVSAEGLPRVRVAHADRVDPDSRRLALDIDPDVELRPYVVAPEMTLTLRATGRAPDQTTDVTANVVLDVDVATGCE